MKVQEVVRSVPGVVWTPGRSVCYRDTSYTKTKKKVRFNFYVEINGTVGHCETGPFAKKVKAALKKAGHEFTDVFVNDCNILVYQEFPVEIKELS